MKSKTHKTGLVVGLLPEQYRIADLRLNKPVCHQQIEGGKITGSMLLQDIETALIEKGKEITYFCPNNVAVLLSISFKSLGKASELYDKFFHSPSMEFRLEKIEEDKKTFLNRVSSTVCDYIEHIQIAVVFAYTALETFANLSIPEAYLYQTESKSKSTRETYDKEAIERWLSLKVKVQYILREIYGTAKVERQKWWGHFSDLEKYRNDIIHQKTITSTSFYKEYFKAKVFRACESPLPIIKFFYEAHAENNRTNPIWPWLVNEKNYFPVNVQYDSRSFEVIGNVYEGIKK
ncbi:MAG: hypothetical protein ABIA11_01740 [Patescibacteria group bacterium]